MKPILVALFALGLSSAAVVAQAQICPATDPNQNYNCPIGPIYALPGWGNVPWSQPQYAQSIVAGDLDGDGRDELIGRDFATPRVLSQVEDWECVFDQTGSVKELRATGNGVRVAP